MILIALTTKGTPKKKGASKRRLLSDTESAIDTTFEPLSNTPRKSTTPRATATATETAAQLIALPPNQDYLKNMDDFYGRLTSSQLNAVLEYQDIMQHLVNCTGEAEVRRRHAAKSNNAADLCQPSTSAAAALGRDPLNTGRTAQSDTDSIHSHNIRNNATHCRFCRRFLGSKYNAVEHELRDHKKKLSADLIISHQSYLKKHNPIPVDQRSSTSSDGE